MPTDLSVQAVGPVFGASENPAQPKPETFTPPAQAPPPSAHVLVTNPTLRFDVASGLVVIEYHDAAGDVTTSIPTLRQIEAYRQWSQPLPGQTSAPRPAALQTSAPQAAAAETAAPQDAASQDVASQTAASQTAAPQTAASAEALQIPEPQPSALQTSPPPAPPPPASPPQVSASQVSASQTLAPGPGFPASPTRNV